MNAIAAGPAGRKHVSRLVRVRDPKSEVRDRDVLYDVCNDYSLDRSTTERLEDVLNKRHHAAHGSYAWHWGVADDRVDNYWMVGLVGVERESNETHYFVAPPGLDGSVLTRDWLRS